MIKKVYNYLFYRTYEIILKTNQFSPESSSSRFLSVVFVVNILSIYSFIFNDYTPFAFYSFGIFAFIISILNLRYFNSNKCKTIIFEFKDLKVNNVFKYLTDSYLCLSFLFLLISIGAGYITIMYYLGILLLIKLITLFWKE